MRLRAGGALVLLQPLTFLVIKAAAKTRLYSNHYSLLHNSLQRDVLSKLAMT